MTRNIFFAVLIAALGWSGYWWVGATAQQAALDGWLEGRRDAGWAADRAELTVRGYPNRFDTVIRGLELADPVSEWSWSAPEFQILALSYKPNHIIAVWPGTQVISSPRERIEVTSQLTRGSVRFQPDTQLALQETRIEIDGMSLASTEGWNAGITEGQLAIRRSPPGSAPDFGYDVSLTARDIALPEPVRDRLDPARLLPPNFERADVRLTPVFDAEWNRAAVEGPPPLLNTLNVDNFSFAWGEMELTVTGRLDADALGYADGELNVIARNWRDMLDLGVRAGAIPADFAGSLESGLAIFAQVTGDTDMLDAKIGFRRGSMWLGVIPIGEAPRLR